MPDATHVSSVRRFGAFEINLQSGELRKNGMRLRLSGQPFQVLAVLVERPGEMVTREELQSKLWPADTFVDFDHGSR
jgi:DNA-binding response OmpR family regulator